MTFDISVEKSVEVRKFKLDYSDEFLVPVDNTYTEPYEKYTVHIYVSGGYNLDFVLLSEEKANLFVSKVVEYYNDRSLLPECEFDDESVDMLWDLRHDVHSGKIV